LTDPIAQGFARDLPSTSPKAVASIRSPTSAHLVEQHHIREAECAEVGHLAAQFVLDGLRGCTERFVGGGENHVREQLGVVRVDRARVDRDLHELAGAVCLHRDHAAARRGLADLALRLLLGAHHLLLICCACFISAFMSSFMSCPPLRLHRGR
jgi:hypothetical protein